MAIEDIFNSKWYAPGVYPNGGIGVHAKHPLGGAAAGDEETNDAEPLALKLSAVSEANQTLILDGGVYICDGKLTGKRVHIDCRGGVVELRRSDGSTDPLIEVSGEIGEFVAIDSDALKDTDKIVCAALASQCEPGTWLQLTSDALFVDRVQGEGCIVREVDGDTIYLNEPLNDTYQVSDNARIAIVDPGSFVVTGRLKITSPRDTVNRETKGIVLAYCMTPRGELDLSDIGAGGLTIYSCYRPRFHIFANNVRIQNNNEGQPVLVMNSTMHAHVTGVAAHVRHAVACGAAPAYYGVPWHVRVDMVGVQGARGIAIFDAHPDTGSVDWGNSVAIGADASDPAQTPSRAPGFTSGARYNYFPNVRCVRCSTGVQPRTDSDVIKVMDIGRITMEECTGAAFSMNAPDVTIEKLRVGRVRGATGTVAAINILQGTIESWDIGDIDVDGKIMFVGTSANVTVPNHLKINRASSRFASGQAASVRAVEVQNDGIAVVQLYDVYSEAGELFRANTALQLLEIIGGGGKNANARYINLEANVGTLRLLGGNYDDAQNASSALVRMTNTVTVTNMEIAPSRVTGTNLTRAVNAASGAVIAKIKYGGDLGSITTKTSGVTPGMIVVAGSFDDPLIMMGAGDPEGAVTAPIGRQWLRSDGGADSVLYMKETGTGNTGWSAMAGV